MEPLDEATDHIRGQAGGRLIVEYGDYECPYSRKAYREIQRVALRLDRGSSETRTRMDASIGPIGLSREDGLPSNEGSRVRSYVLVS